MTRPVLLLWLLVLAASTAALWWAASGALASRTQAAAARAELALVAQRVGELERLRVAAPALPPAGSSDLARLAASALAAAGRPASTLTSVSPGGQSAIAGPGGTTLAVRRQATLTLERLTLPQAGSFLSAWRAAEPAWTVSGLDLAPGPVDPRTASTGGDRPLRVVVTLECLSAATEHQTGD